jgi:hypothetical protein
MATIPATQNGSKLGLRQIRAQQLREQDERRQRELVATAARANQARAAASGGAAEPSAATGQDGDGQQYQGTGPVGSGEYVVKQGECISSIAKDQGYFWETIWNDPGNTQLRETRRNPHILLPGDRVVIPARTPKRETGGTEMRHRFCRKGEPSWLRILVKKNDVPQANEPYVLQIDALRFTGTTDGQGGLRERIPGNAKGGTLYVGANQERYDIQIGHMDPIDAITGIQARLNNLGFLCGPPDGTLSAATIQAIRGFQAQHKLPISGQPDEGTRRKLVEQHGS